jgi:16S rRNA (guanine966-N2)-methyltransferase
VTRVIAGTLGGRRLRTPPGSATRPTTDRVREALFSSLGELAGRSVLDLYAGSGALGIEALSRGASRATFVEHDQRAATVLRANLADLGLTAGQVVVADVSAFLRRDPVAYDAPYDVVLADPPYAEPVGDVLSALVGWVGDVVVLERSSRDPAPDWPAGIEAVRSRTYGETALWYGRSL